MIFHAIGSRMLSVGGDVNTKCQGVYANIVTSEDPASFQVYVGSAAAISGEGRIRGLRRRVLEHLSFVRSPTRQPASGQLHSREIRRADRHCNFVVLAYFIEPVVSPLVHITEAIMTIFFASWHNEVFASLRPKGLPDIISGRLNNANPLNYGVCSGIGPRARERMKQNGRRRAEALRDAQISKLIKGGPIHIAAYKPRPSYWAFRFFLCGQTFHIPSKLGLSIGLDRERLVHAVFELASDQHQHPYATAAVSNDSAR
ncbi:hypothetical protein N7540_010948 [Penicillium herquei]|nr:hypothetical protein N7540_010948 [Penicillium herquei]